MPYKTKQRVRRLGILTGGGDVPGINAAIKAIVYRAETENIDILGIRRGWEGLAYINPNQGELLYNPDDDRSWDRYLMPLSRRNTRTIDRTGGTILGSTRTNPARVRVDQLPPHMALYAEGRPANENLDLTQLVVRNLEALHLDGLIVLGGDDTLSFGATLAAKGYPVWGIPKTMDNDVPGTDYSIGFQTAISRASEAITRLRSTAGSHAETALFRMFGRDSGFTALETAIVTWADRVLIPEAPLDLDRLADFVRRDRKANPSRYSLVIVSEGVELPQGEDSEPKPAESATEYKPHVHTNVAEQLGEQLSARIPLVRFLPVDLTYMLRSGEPDEYDKHMAIFYANIIMKAVEDGTHGIMVGYLDGKYVYTDMPGKNLPPRRVPLELYNTDRYRPNFEGLTATYTPQRHG